MTRFRRENEENFHDGSHKYGEDWELHEKPKSLKDKTGVVILLGLIGQVVRQVCICDLKKKVGYEQFPRGKGPAAENDNHSESSALLTNK